MTDRLAEIKLTPRFKDSPPEDREYLLAEVDRLREGLNKLRYGYHVIVKGEKAHSGKRCIVCGSWFAAGCISRDCWLAKLIGGGGMSDKRKMAEDNDLMWAALRAIVCLPARSDISDIGAKAVVIAAKALELLGGEK